VALPEESLIIGILAAGGAAGRDMQLRTGSGQAASTAALGTVYDFTGITSASYASYGPDPASGRYPVMSETQRGFNSSLIPFQVLGTIQAATLAPQIAVAFESPASEEFVASWGGEVATCGGGSGGLGYRVMNSQEYAGASIGKWGDSSLVIGDPIESGSKWLWTTEGAAKRWQVFVQQNGDEGLLTTVTTIKPLSAYPTYAHPPQGTAVHGPIWDLGHVILK
jgi:hypothetical protein